MKDTNTMAKPVNRAATQIYLQLAKSCQKKRVVDEQHGTIQPSTNSPTEGLATFRQKNVKNVD